MDELNRKLVHISVLVFVVLAQFVGGLVAAFYFLFIAATLLIYSSHIRRERRRLAGLIRRMEKDIRRAVMKLERRDAAWPMMGAFWLFFGCGLSFLVFPLGVASAACAMVAVGDGLSTLVGKRWGRSKVVGSKSWEGTITMFVACIFTGMYFVGPVIAVFGAVAAAFFELLPELGCFRRHREMGIIDDNLLVPLAAGAVMLAAYVF